MPLLSVLRFSRGLALPAVFLYCRDLGGSGIWFFVLRITVLLPGLLLPDSERLA